MKKKGQKKKTQKTKQEQKRKKKVQSSLWYFIVDERFCCQVYGSEIKSRRDKLAQPSVKGTFQWRIDVSGLCNMVKKKMASCSRVMEVVNGANFCTSFSCTCSDGSTVDALLISLGLTSEYMLGWNFKYICKDWNSWKK